MSKEKSPNAPAKPAQTDTIVRISVKVRTKAGYGFPGAGSQAYRDAELLVGLSMVAVRTPDGTEKWYPTSDLLWAEPA
jgi:hypothetical protein